MSLARWRRVTANSSPPPTPVAISRHLSASVPLYPLPAPSTRTHLSRPALRLLDQPSPLPLPRSNLVHTPKHRPTSSKSISSSPPFIPGTSRSSLHPFVKLRLCATRHSSTMVVSEPVAASQASRLDGKLVAAKLEHPDLDNRSYRVVRLQNNLEVLIVHDPDTDKASAALDVHVGNFSDKEDLQGQAHAVEHLLFMGTEKYPKENEYSQYLAEHSGHSNAYTASTSTNYYFEVGHEHFQGALDRFAQFFIAPLFLEETLDRELRAVDSENKKNLQSDTWRLHQLSKSLSNPQHPFCHFSTGNLQTLKELPAQRGVNVREEFMKFHDRYYSANTMKLVVLGREPLDTLQDWVQNLFSSVRNKSLPDPKFEGQPLTKNELSTQIFAKSVMDTRQLDIVFPFLDEEELYESQPSRYASHLIGHEGPGSILAYLKKKGWANSLSAGPTHVANGSAFFHVTIKLTKDGLDRYEEVVKVVFHYINLIKDIPVQEWIFKELQEVAAVDFKFRQKSPASKFTSRLSAVMQKPLPREWLLSGTTLIRKYDPKAIKESLEYLRPDNFRLSIASRECARGQFDKKEKWYGTDYRVEKIPENFLGEIKSTATVGIGAGRELATELHLPHKNEFIPTNFDVHKKPVEKPQKVPTLIKNTELSRIWFKKDDTFWVPKANLNITLRNPLVNATPGNAVAVRMFCELLRDALNEYAYDAEIAGLDYSVHSSSVGFEIELSGYNHKMSVLLEKVITCIRDLVITQERFDIIKERSIRAFKNWEFQQPYYQIGEFTKYLTSPKMWLNEESLSELETLTVDDIRTLVPRLAKQIHIEALVHGNLHKEDALQYSALIESILQPRALPIAQFDIRRSLIIPPGGNYVFSRPLKDPENVNSVIEYSLHVGELENRKLRMQLALFSQLTEEPCFDQLRTKEQLGYIVFSGSRYSATTMLYRVIVQSERTAPYLESRINAFLGGYRDTLEKMTDKELNGHINAVVVRRTEKMKNLNQESNRLWNYIGNEFYDFEQIDIEVDIIRSITKAEMIDFYNRYIDPSSSTRAKISVHMHAATKADPATLEKKKPLLAQALAQLLSKAGVTVDLQSLTTAFDGLDLSKPDAMFSAIENHLKTSQKISEDSIPNVLEQGAELLRGISGIGGNTADEDLGEFGEDITKDVTSFKAGLELSKGARPVKPLEMFEETAVKL